MACTLPVYYPTCTKARIKNPLSLLLLVGQAFFKPSDKGSLLKTYLKSHLRRIEPAPLKKRSVAFFPQKKVPLLLIVEWNKDFSNAWIGGEI